MRISTKGRYALMVLIDLAEQGQEKPVSLRSVAERQGISEKYLEGIVARLVAADLVDSIRGKYGGYRLSKAPGGVHHNRDSTRHRGIHGDYLHS